MVVPGDIRPILFASRFLGSPHHVVTEDDIRVTRYGTVYTIVCFLFYLSNAITSVCVLATIPHFGLKDMILTITRVVLSYGCLLTDIAFTTIWYSKIRGALSQLRTFDRATRFKDGRKSGRIRNVCRGLVLLIVGFWTGAGYVTYRYEPAASLHSGLLYGLINSAVSLQIVSFCAITFLLCERYRHLCQIILFPEARGKIVVLDRLLNRQFRLQEIWWLHCSLSNATETINSVYAVQLLFWVASMSFNTLSRIYTINLNGGTSIFLKVRESMLVAACVGNLLLITGVCHATASRDNVEAAAYFQARKVHFFSVGSLIRIDLPLLLSIASGITTYLVILHAANNV